VPPIKESWISDAGKNDPEAVGFEQPNKRKTRCTNEPEQLKERYRKLVEEVAEFRNHVIKGFQDDVQRFENEIYRMSLREEELQLQLQKALNERDRQLEKEAANQLCAIQHPINCPTMSRVKPKLAEDFRKKQSWGFQEPTGGDSKSSSTNNVDRSQQLRHHRSERELIQRLKEEIFQDERFRMSPKDERPPIPQPQSYRHSEATLADATKLRAELIQSLKQEIFQDERFRMSLKDERPPMHPPHFHYHGPHPAHRFPRGDPAHHRMAVPPNVDRPQPQSYHHSDALAEAAKHRDARIERSTEDVAQDETFHFSPMHPAIVHFAVPPHPEKLSDAAEGAQRLHQGVVQESTAQSLANRQNLVQKGAVWEETIPLTDASRGQASESAADSPGLVEITARKTPCVVNAATTTSRETAEAFGLRRRGAVATNNHQTAVGELENSEEETDKEDEEKRRDTRSIIHKRDISKTSSESEHTEPPRHPAYHPENQRVNSVAVGRSSDSDPPESRTEYHQRHIIRTPHLLEYK
jgi:hypothetical protein